MKDRIVQYPNRYQLVPVAGQNSVYDIQAVPGVVTEAGTPVNKGSLLSDTTDGLYGGVGTVDAGLSKIWNKEVSDVSNLNSAIANLNNTVNAKQNITDHSLITGSKTIVGAINEVKTNTNYRILYGRASIVGQRGTVRHAGFSQIPYIFITPRDSHTKLGSIAVWIDNEISQTNAQTSICGKFSNASQASIWTGEVDYICIGV